MDRKKTICILISARNLKPYLDPYSFALASAQSFQPRQTKKILFSGTVQVYLPPIVLASGWENGVHVVGVV